MSANLSRKTFIKGMLGVGTTFYFGNMFSSNILKKNYPTIFHNKPITFSQTPLKYAFDGLEPYIDTETMNIHYGKLGAKYTRNLNKYWSEEVNSAKVKDLKLLFKYISTYSENLRRNAGGYYNHEMFWKVMTSPSNTTNIQNLEIEEAIAKRFGSIDTFKDLFAQEAKKVFGSGWCWLIKDKNDALQITSTRNQNNPLMDTEQVVGEPLLCLDIWEHAYFLKYKNRRDEYINNFWYVVNWDFVNELFIA